MIREHLFSSGTGMRLTHHGTTAPDPARTDGQKGIVAVTIACHLARCLIAQPREFRPTWRRLLLTALRKARTTERAACIDQMLNVFVSEGGPDGLDDAIDVLAKSGPIVLEYAWDLLQRDLLLWHPAADRAYRPSDDYWFVLLRAVARSDAPDRDRLRLITCCAAAQSRGVREGVVEALRDLNTPAALERLRKFAQTDDDAFIRKIAREALEDVEK
jgi:hypothetical protein